MPAGFMEEGETAERSRQERTRKHAADIEVGHLLAVYSVPRISQVHLIYRAKLKNPGVEAGPESSDVKLLSWDEIPWSDLAFPSVHWALHHFREVENKTEFTPFLSLPRTPSKPCVDTITLPSRPGENPFEGLNNPKGERYR